MNKDTHLTPEEAQLASNNYKGEEKKALFITIRKDESTVFVICNFGCLKKNMNSPDIEGNISACQPYRIILDLVNYTSNSPS